RRWRSYRLPTYQASLLEQAREMQYVDVYRDVCAALHRAAANAKELFGDLWHGEQSRWDVLEAYIRWVVEFRATWVRYGLKEQAVYVASCPAPDVSSISALKIAADLAQAALESVTQLTS